MGDLWPCEPWATDEFVVSWCTAAEAAAPARVTSAAAIATAILYVKTGRGYGICEHVWRPCGGCGCGDTAGCGCATYPSLEPERGPAVAVSEVKVDGVVLDGSAYRLTDALPWRLPTLLRVDGGLWPCCQDLAADTTEPGTSQITYTYGNPLPPGADVMAATLACEYLGLWGNGPCRLPKRLTTINREGLTASFLDTLESLASGLLGLPEVDAWIATINPGGADREPKVLNVDTMGYTYDPTDLRPGLTTRSGPGLRGPWPAAIGWPSV